MSEHETPEAPEFWESRYQAHRTAWDLGHPAPALLEWLKAHPRNTGRAIVLGCGRGYDAIALASSGYDVTGVDFAPSAITEARDLAERHGRSVRFLQQDIFELGPEYDQAFDLVFEHTCFCVFAPERRTAYRDLIARLLKPGGMLLGVFFTGYDPDGPPFGVTPAELEHLFSAGFDTLEMREVETSDAHAFEKEHLGVFRLQ